MTSVTFESGDSIPRTQVFDFDTVGNRESVVGLIPGSSTNEEGTYLLDNTLPEPADLPVHQYTAVPAGSNSFDANGNLIEIERDGNPVAVTYDYRNQMTQFGDTQYKYDPIGRRISRATSDLEETSYCYLGWQVLEEQNQDGETLATYVYGNFLDEPIEAI
jgi:YD repeat-containing protein